MASCFFNSLRQSNKISKGIWNEANFIKTYDVMRNQLTKCLSCLMTNPSVILSQMGNQRVNKCMPLILLWEVYARAVYSCCMQLLRRCLDDVIICTLGEDIHRHLHWRWRPSKLVFEVENRINCLILIQPTIASLYLLKQK